MKDFMEIATKAKEIYDLGIKMQQTFSKNPETLEQYMTMAIAAGLTEAYNKQSASITVEDNFGEQIKRLRTEKKITLRMIEDATGISNSYLSQLENGKIKKPSHSVVTKILNFLLDGKSEFYLLGNGFKPTYIDLGFNPLVPGSGLKGL